MSLDRPAIGRPQPPDPAPLGFWGWMLVVGVFLALVFLKGLAAQVLQGDWHCAYQRCVLVRPR